MGWILVFAALAAANGLGGMTDAQGPAWEAERDRRLADTEPAELAALAASADWRVRAEAEALLAWRADPAGAARLWDVAPSAARGGILRFSGDVWRTPEAGPVLLARLLHGDDDAATRAALAEALRHTDAAWGPAFAWQLQVEPSADVRAIEAEILRRSDAPEVLPALRGALADPDATVRAAAARALGGRPDGATAGDVLIVALADPDPRVRADAARAAGHLRLGGGWAGLQALLADPDATVRLRALRALEALDGPAAATLAAPMKADRDPKVARAARQVAGD